MNNIFKDTKKLTYLGVMLGLTLFFTFTLGLIPGPLASLAPLIFVPTIITSIIYGVEMGAIMGFLAGLCTMLRAYVAPAGILDPFFLNPLISVLPRIFIGIVPYYIYKIFMKIIKSSAVSSFIAGACGAIINTALVMLMLYLVYAQKVLAAAGMNSFGAFLVVIITGSAILEAIISAIFTMAIMIVYPKRKNNLEDK